LPSKKAYMQKVMLFILLLSAIVVQSCRKENTSNDCGSLKTGIATNNINEVKKAITNFIDALPSKEYNESNIAMLSQRLSTSCSVTVESTCFDCIKTLPSQTEIRISVTTAVATVAKTIDLSYTAANKIVFHNMHD